MKCVACGAPKMVKRTISSGSRFLPIAWSLVVLATAYFSHNQGLPIIAVGVMGLMALYIAAPHSQVWQCKSCPAYVPRPAGIETTIRVLVIIFSLFWVTGTYFSYGCARMRTALEQAQERKEKEELAEKLPEQLEKMNQARKEIEALSPQNQLNKLPTREPPAPNIEPALPQPLTKLTKWTDKRGRHLEAALISVTDGKGQFKRPSGEIFEYEIENLSADDIELIQFALEQRKK